MFATLHRPRARHSPLPLIAALSLLAACAVAAAPAPVAAQGHAGYAEAQRVFAEAVRLIDDGQFAEALDRLERVRAIRETPAVVFNIAVAQRGLRRYRDAIANLERYAELAGARVDATRRAESEQMLREMRAALATVVVHASAPTAMTVTVDERTLAPGELDRPLTLDPGPHVFRAFGPGLNPIVVSRRLANGETARVELAPTAMFVTGTLQVTASIPEAVVRVDGRVQPLDGRELVLRPGDHVVEVRAPGFATYRATVRLRAGQAERVRVTLVREGGVLTRWWFWTGAAVIAAAVPLLIIFAPRPVEQPDNGTFDFSVEAVRAR